MATLHFLATATMDGLTVDGTGVHINLLSTNASENYVWMKNTEGSAYIGQDAGVLQFWSGGNTGGVGAEVALKIDGNNDISFYEDTGTTAKLFWDASAESLGIGSTPEKLLHIKTAVNNTAFVRIESTATDSYPTLSLKNDAREYQLTAHGPLGDKFTIYDGTAGAHRFVIDSSGNVLVGTTSAYSGGKLSVNGGIVQPSGVQNVMGVFGTSGLQMIGVTGGDNVIGTMGANEPLVLRTASAERMRIDSSGRVGIGRTPSISNSKLEVGGADNVSLINVEASGVTGGMGIGSTGLQFFHGSTARMRIDSSGNLLVGKSDTGDYVTGIEMQPAGALLSYRTGGVAGIFGRTDNGETVRFTNNSSIVGTISTTGSATSYNTSSDQRLKENIADADDSGSKIDAIQVRQYDWKADGSHQDYGMIAQELLEVAPEAVSQGETEDVMMGVDYSKLVPMLIKEIQSLRNRVAQLETGE